MSEKPQWIKARSPDDRLTEQHVREVLDKFDVNTVCREADCPNTGECWGSGTATFMILGDTCTRNCRFCDVRTGDPEGTVDLDEPLRIKEACRELGLEYAVLTSVDRDDLSDGGASHFREVIQSLKGMTSPPQVEALIPDFSGDEDSLEMIATSGAEVIGHNLETVRRLTPEVRDRRAGYDLSLDVLKSLKDFNDQVYTKSSLIVGLGETEAEVTEALRDLKSADVDIVTIGQYLRPSEDQLPVAKFWEPEAFDSFQETAEELAFPAVLSGPFVRSSYKAKKIYRNLE